MLSPPLLGDGRRAVTVNNACIEVAALVQGEHRVSENCVDAASRLPKSKHAVDARVVNFGKTLCIFLDRQLLPLTSHVKQSQDVVEDPMQWQFCLRPSAAGQKMGQDKLLELHQGQTRRGPFSNSKFNPRRNNMELQGDAKAEVYPVPTGWASSPLSMKRMR